ncbi:acid phosphatase 1-like isoform X1 [Vicia villosa]|uniref:acid phosphatase 1-like isoform X1 n=1 Tax=Vicia villosa TaxID=3911 RepID=UPI00273A87B9|nr:acid phosphatase 1-like isoform X1 [Vicia villosa]
MMLKIKSVQTIVAGLTFLLALLTNLLLKLQRQHNRKAQKLQTMMMIRSELDSSSSSEVDDERYGLSWRLAVESNNNVRPWKTVPARCYKHVENYILDGQYELDMNIIVDEIIFYAKSQIPVPSNKDAWILDVDDTCISNIPYYKNKRFGCEPFDSTMFKAWINKGMCPANPVVLRLFKTLIQKGFKVFLLTGRYEGTLAKITMDNLHSQGFIGYQRLILRSDEYKGQSAVKYKSSIRKEIEKEGYRIWGNVGDQWTDLQGDSLGNRTFKLPNPMYCIS